MLRHNRGSTRKTETSKGNGSKDVLKDHQGSTRQTTSVSSDPIKIKAVCGLDSITGTAISPQLSAGNDGLKQEQVGTHDGCYCCAAIIALLKGHIADDWVNNLYLGRNLD